MDYNIMVLENIKGDPKQSGNHEKMLEDVKQMELNYRRNGRKSIATQNLN